jgi:hypothetical protein
MNFIPQVYIFHHWVFVFVFVFLLINNINNNSKFQFFVLLGIAYFPVLESIGRLHSLDPFIPWEWGKYFILFLFLFLLIVGKIKFDLKFILSFVILLITILKGDTTWKLFFFNAIAIILYLFLYGYFSMIKLQKKSFLETIKFLTLPLVLFSFSSLLKLQEFQIENIQLESTFILDKIPSNQIATYMGFAFFIFMFLYQKNVIVLKNLTINLILAILMLILGLISFSRGGIVVGFIGFILIYIRGWSDIYTFFRLKYLVIVIPSLIFSLFYINQKTNGNLFLRYSGETAGTLAGNKEKTINSVTTNRFDIMIGDLKVFGNNWLLGVNVGRSKDYRTDLEDQLTHIEFSRLLAEHGIFGIIVVLILFRDMLYFFNKNNSNNFKLLFLILGILTTFHGAMRTSVPIVLMLISLINIIPDKPILTNKN